jgi:hypothetical protein
MTFLNPADRFAGQVRADPDSDDLAVLAMVTVVPGAWRAADSFSLGGGPVRTSIVGAAGMEATYVVLLDAGAALRWQYLVMVIEEAAEMAGVCSSWLASRWRCRSIA